MFYRHFSEQHSQLERFAASNFAALARDDRAFVVGLLGQGSRVGLGFADRGYAWTGPTPSTS